MNDKTLHHQTFQVPKMEVLTCVGKPAPKIAFFSGQHLHFRYLKVLVTSHVTTELPGAGAAVSPLAGAGFLSQGE